MSVSPVMTILFSILVSDIPPFTVWEQKEDLKSTHTQKHMATIIQNSKMSFDTISSMLFVLV